MKLAWHGVGFTAVNFTQTLQQIVLVGRLTFTQDVATKLVNRLQQQINEIKYTGGKGLRLMRELLQAGAVVVGSLPEAIEITRRYTHHKPHTYNHPSPHTTPSRAHQTNPATP